MEEAGHGVDACSSVHCCTSRGHLWSGFCAIRKMCEVQQLQQMALETTPLVFPYPWVWPVAMWRNMWSGRFLSCLAWGLWVCSDPLEFQVQRERFDNFIHCLSYFSCLAWPKQPSSAGGVIRHCGGPGGGVWHEREGEERKKLLGFKKNNWNMR